MIERISYFLQPVYRYDDPLTQQRARGLLIFLAITFLSVIVRGVFQFVRFVEIIPSDVSPDFFPPILIVAPFLIIAAFMAVRHGYYQVTSVAIVVVPLLILGFFADLALNDFRILILVIPIILSGLLLGWQWTVLAAISAVIILANAAFVPDVAFTLTSEFLFVSAVIVSIAVLVVVFGTNIQVSALRYVRDYNKLNRLLNIMSHLDDATDERGATNTVINFIQDDLQYMFARTYLAQGSEITQGIQPGLSFDQVDANIGVSLARNSAIYEALRSKAIVHIHEDSSTALRQHLLSGTQAALAVPILDSEDTVLGVIDIQSEDNDIFTASEIDTITLLARQLGQILQHKRLIKSLRQDLRDTRERAAIEGERLQRYERLERQATTATWQEYLRERGTEYLGFDILEQNSLPVEAAEMSTELASAIQTGEITVKKDNGQQVVSVPIELRGQTLGAMSFRVPEGSQIIGARQQELIRNVVQRLSLALENKRLFEQSQTQAQRESRANEVGNLLLSSTDVNTVLELAASNFNDVLGAIQTQIRLRPEAQEISEGETPL